MKEQVKKPETWTKYKNPYHNLLYAVILQAAIDTNGYTNEGAYHDGADARDFCRGAGKIIFGFLQRQELADISTKAKYYRNRKGKKTK